MPGDCFVVLYILIVFKKCKIIVHSENLDILEMSASVFQKQKMLDFEAKSTKKSNATFTGEVKINRHHKLNYVRN